MVFCGMTRYAQKMRNDRDLLLRLAANRRRRICADGRPQFELTREHVESSAQTAMRLARASKSQVSERGRDKDVVCA
jgi:hypothetical protein